VPAPVPAVSIVVPVVNDTASLERLIGELGRHTSADLEVIVVDGGGDGDLAMRLPRSVRLLRAPCASRGAQLKLGITGASHDWLWLLHADSAGLDGPLSYLAELTEPAWGRFDVRLSAGSPRRERALRVVAAGMNWRSRLTGICTGDQGIFVHRALLERAGGMPPQKLMEDIELSRRLKRVRRPLAPRVALTTSGRRWEANGILATVLSMWSFRLRYWLGADPDRLAASYYGRR